MIPEKHFDATSTYMYVNEHGAILMLDTTDADGNDVKVNIHLSNEHLQQFVGAAGSIVRFHNDYADALYVALMG